MAQSTSKIRLYISADLAEGELVSIGRDQAHYLTSVMRQSVGGEILLFNGRDGEWNATLVTLDKRQASLEPTQQTRTQTMPPDLWLLFAPIKKTRTDFIAEKACELGCRRIVPVFTQFTNTERVNVDRLRAHGVEAAEQCGLLSIPDVAGPAKLSHLLDNWPKGRFLIFCNERGQSPPFAEAVRGVGSMPAAILIGPEGGFSAEEVSQLLAHPACLSASLGPRILRADTAAVAALSIWQSVLGDWR